MDISFRLSEDRQGGSCLSTKYLNCPIVEALCEFHFEPDPDWDMTIPGLFYDEVKQDYPHKRQQMGIGFQMTPNEKGVAQNIGPLPPKIQFVTDDETEMIQVSQNLLVINKLKPYSTWNEFKGMIKRGCDTFYDIAHPKGIQRIGLRYINKIEMPYNEGSDNIQLEDYFHIYPEAPPTFPSYTNFFTRIEMPYHDARDFLLITIGTMEDKIEGLAQIILDLEYILAIPNGLSQRDIEVWIDEAHGVISEVFERCITPNARELFNGGE